MESLNSLVNPLLTDLYELTMAYAYWKNGRQEEPAVFDLFFRKNPFEGEFAIFAGLTDVIHFVSNFKFSPDHLAYLKQIMPGCDQAFFDWLKGVDCAKVQLYAVKEGSLVFPRMPLIRVEGPLAIAQMIETTLLTLVNYASLIATNAARFRIAAGPGKTLLEFGLRRAQGPDGGLSASRYSYLGGFDGTSNVLAGQLFGIPVRGTHAHSFVQSFMGISDLPKRTLVTPSNETVDLVDLVLGYRERLGFQNTNAGELAAFIAYAQAFPKGFLALVDTYDTLQSGIPNFLSIAAALFQVGYTPLGIRLDSGDLAFLSQEARQMFIRAGEISGYPISACQICASNDINESVLVSLNQQGHSIDTFGIGTNLVTCQAQPAMGCVYKLVEINHHPRIKLSQDIGKITIPGRKQVYRLLGGDGRPILDIMAQIHENPPQVGQKVFCRHPFDETKRVNVIPSAVRPLLQPVWTGQISGSLPALKEIRREVIEQLQSFRQDHLRTLNPTPYKVSVSNELYGFMHELWLREAPVKEMK